ncbi:MAG: DNA repair protein RadC [Bacteroidales bacterium]|nr:DNA repair protein RadC [Bacteroidales bacterium]
MKSQSIKNWAADDRPREKLLQKGPRALSDAELIALLIGSGTRELSAVELSRHILMQCSNNLTELARHSAKELMKYKGIGEAKAISIVAALEIGRRRKDCGSPVRPKITSSADAAAVFFPLVADLPHEEFWAATLDRSNKLKEQFMVSSGGISGTVTDVRILLKKSLEASASSIIVCHNHPSGNIEPSRQDKEITQKIKEAAKLLDIQLLDHIIIAGQKYYSFADEGLI